MLSTHFLTYALENRPLIERASLTFLPGHLYGLMGANGSGKSTFLKLLSGIKTPSHGWISYNDEDLQTKDRKWIACRIAYMGENLTVPYPFTVYEVVQMGCYFTSNNKRTDWIQSILYDMHAEHLANRIFLTLSSGERQRILIAQALATGAEVLLLDEPTSHLDFFHSSEIWGYLRNLAQKGKMIIVSTHDFNAVEQFCHHTLSIHQGTILGPEKFSIVMNSPPFRIL